MASFIVRKLDEKMWAQFKARAAAEGRPLRWVQLRLMQLYADKGLDALEQAPIPDAPAVAPGPPSTWGGQR